MFIIRGTLLAPVPSPTPRPATAAHKLWQVYHLINLLLGDNAIYCVAANLIDGQVVFPLGNYPLFKEIAVQSCICLLKVEGLAKGAFS